MLDIKEARALTEKPIPIKLKLIQSGTSLVLTSVKEPIIRAINTIVKIIVSNISPTKPFKKRRFINVPILFILLFRSKNAN